MALDTDLNLRILANLTSQKDLALAASPLDYSKRVQLTNGTGVGKADRLFSDQRTVALSSSEDLDLVGTLVDDLGVVFSPTRIKMIYVEALAANTNNVIVGAAAGTQWAALLGTTGTVTLRPGAFFLACAGVADATGYVCAAGATDLLKVANSGAGTSVDYKIILVGVSV
jgi:hypothetical protein